MPRFSRSASRLGARFALAVMAPFLLADAVLAQPFPPRELAVLVPPEIAGVYPAGSSNMGMPLPLEGITGLLVHVEDPGGGETDADPGEACEPITNSDELAGNVAFVRRGACNLCFKIVNVSKTTDATAIVIYNDERVPDADTSVMDIQLGFCEGDWVPAVFVSRATGLLLLGAMATDDVMVRLQPAGATDTEAAPEPAALALSAP